MFTWQNFWIYIIDCQGIPSSGCVQSEPILGPHPPRPEKDLRDLPSNMGTQKAKNLQRVEVPESQGKEVEVSVVVDRLRKSTTVGRPREKSKGEGEIPGNTIKTWVTYWVLVEGENSSRLIVAVKVGVRSKGKQRIGLYKCPRPLTLPP